MTLKDSFCPSPWFHMRINNSGHYEYCRWADKAHRNTGPNISDTTPAEFFNQNLIPIRQQLLNGERPTGCAECYQMEAHNKISGRQKQLLKIGVQLSEFDKMLASSPWMPVLVNHTPQMPQDWQIDLGNYCNLACIMCSAKASSVIASQEVVWGIESSRQYLGTDWTKDTQVWNKFLTELVTIPQLQNIHFMGGETLLTNRFENLVDAMIQAQRFEVCFSFVTNGTVFKPQLLEKLKKFQRVGIEVSIETVDQHNAYQRQGTDTDLVLQNIDRYLGYCNNNNITLTLRPAPSLLSVGYYAGLLRYAMQKQLIVKSNLCFDPEFLNPVILPAEVKQQYQQSYDQLLQELNDVNVGQDFNASDPHNYLTVIKEQATMIKHMLGSPAPVNADSLLKKLVDHCAKWDKVYGLDARELYPELETVWTQHGY
jgi:hypothetical protein